MPAAIPWVLLASVSAMACVSPRDSSVRVEDASEPAPGPDSEASPAADGPAGAVGGDAAARDLASAAVDASTADARSAPDATSGGGDAPGWTITEFPLATPKSGIADIAAGPDGNVWFTEAAVDRIGRINPRGDITEFPLPKGAAPFGITGGPDGNVWFTRGDAKIGRISPSGAIAEFTALGSHMGITVGPDGNLWFADNFGNRIGRITTGGQVTFFAVKTPGHPQRVAVGPDGNVWFTEAAEKGGQVGRVTPAGVVTEFEIPAADPGYGVYPDGIAAGKDGNVWFSETGDFEVARITPAGQITEFPVRPNLSPAAGSPYGMTAAVDGTLWFGAYSSIGQLTTDGRMTNYPLPSPQAGAAQVAIGPDGTIWCTEYMANAVARLRL